MSSRPPVCLFAFNRPEHLRQTLDALARNSGAARTALTIFCDGPRGDADADAVAATRAVARAAQGFDSVRVVEREANFGLARSVITGVTSALAASDRVIVMEDDLVTSPWFLDYMRDGLALYADEPRVASVHGYLYPVARPVPETFFIRGADCWGWGTWARAWAGFESDGARLLGQLRAGRLLAEFNHGGRAPIFGRMLEDQIAGRNNSWAIRWHASAWLAGQLTLYPGRSLVQNVGFDSSGTHCKESAVYHVELSDKPITVRPVPVAADPAMAEKFAAFFESLQPPARPEGVRSLLRRLFRRR